MLVVEGLSRRRSGKEERRKPDMPTYISLVNWTEKGITNVKETLRRADRSAELAQKHGCTLVQLYWTVGPYDLVSIFDAPDDRECKRLRLGGRHAGRGQNDHPSRLRPRGDLKDHPKARLRSRAPRAGVATLRPYLSPLFTRVRGRGLLRSLYPRFCISAVL
jgi:uncharacterized protein with GYD domain